jgi:hypothetical protein
MLFRKSASRGARLLLAAIFVMATTIFVSIATQDSAFAATPCSLSAYPASQAIGTETTAEPTYYVSTSTICSATDVPDSHACMAVFTGENGDQSVQCSDVYFEISSDGQVDAWNGGTFYCQDSGLEACAWITVKDQFAYKWQIPAGGGTNTEAIKSYSCSGNCGSGKAAVGSGHLQTADAAEWCIEAWGTDLSGNQVQDPISPIYDTTTSNFSSHHVNLCFD